MKKFVFSVASRATGRLQIKPSGSGDENVGGRKNLQSNKYFNTYYFGQHKLQWVKANINRQKRTVEKP